MSDRDNVFGVEDVISHLGVQVVSEERARELADQASSTAMVQWRAAPTLTAIGNDLDRVASTTSGGGNRENARRRWHDRRVMTMRGGEKTTIPLIVGISFAGIKRMINGREDIVVSQTIEVEGLGEIEVTPLFTAGIDYVAVSDGGLIVPTRVFYGVLYEPTKQREEFKFVPLECADLAFRMRWNDMIDQATTLGTIHKDWPKIDLTETNIGRPGLRVMSFSPRYLLNREFPKMRGGKRIGTDTISVIDTRLGKQVILDVRSQDLPVVDEQAAYPFGELVFRFTEHENSIVVTLLGRAGEVELDTTSMDLSDIVFETNPFETLNLPIERYDSAKARRYVKDCLAMEPDDHNPLYKRAAELQLIPPGLPRASIVAQLRALVEDALERADFLYNEAFDATLAALRLYDPPSIEDMLAGNLLDRVLRKLNPSDAAALWITSHIEGEYNNASTFHRALREALLKGAAKRASYTDPPIQAIVAVVPQIAPQATGEGSTASDSRSDSTSAPEIGTLP